MPNVLYFVGVYSAMAEPPHSFPFFLIVFFHFFAVFMTLNKYILPTLYALKMALRRLERGIYLCGQVEGTSIENTKTERTCKTSNNRS